MPVMQHAVLRGGGMPEGMDMPFGVSGASYRHGDVSH